MFTWLKRIFLGLLTVSILLYSGAYYLVSGENGHALQRTLIARLSFNSEWNIQADPGKGSMGFAPHFVFEKLSAEKPGIKAEFLQLDVCVPLYALFTKNYEKIEIVANKATLRYSGASASTKKSANAKNNNTAFSLSSIPNVSISDFTFILPDHSLKISDFVSKNSKSITASSIEIDNYRFTKNRFDIVGTNTINGILHIAGGVLKPSVAIGNVSSFNVTFDGIPLSLLKEIDSKINVKGVVHGHFSGSATSDFLPTLSGNGSITAKDVVVPYFDLNYYLDLADNLVNKVPSTKNVGNPLLLSEASTNFSIKNGVLYQEQIVGHGPDYSLSGNGAYHFIADRLHYKLKAFRPSDPSKPPLAITVTGSSKSPVITPDTDAYLQYFLKREITKQSDKLLEKLDPSVQDALRGLFKK